MIVVLAKPTTSNEHLSHREFLTGQPEKLRQLVESKSLESLAALTSRPNESPGRSEEDSRTFSARPAADMLKRNKREVKKHLFNKNRLPRYCKDSGLPSDEEIREHHRLEFLKDIAKDIKFL